METSIELILKERKRQIEIEGYDADHDAKHSDGEISLAAACYCVHPMEVFYKEEYHNQTHYKKLIPFDEYEIDDKKNEIKKLVIAGALIVAEIDRLLKIKKDNNAKQSW